MSCWGSEHPHREASTQRTSALWASVPRVLTPHPALLCILMGSVGTIPESRLRLDLTRSGLGQTPDRSWDVHHHHLPKEATRTRLGPWRPDFLHVGQVLRGPHSQETPGAQRRRLEECHQPQMVHLEKSVSSGNLAGAERQVGGAALQRGLWPPLPPPAQTLPSLGTVGTWDECLEPWEQREEVRLHLTQNHRAPSSVSA